MKIVETEIPGVLIIEPRLHGDHRGWFMESWQAQRYADAGIEGPFVQDNMTLSRHGILRGLHVQHPHAQGKLVQVMVGEVFDVAVDIRRGSPTFGKWAGVILSGENHRQFWVPPGFAHGYMVTSGEALFSYKCTDLYHPETEFGVRWDDPDIGIDWPVVGPPVLSEKDENAPLLKEIPAERLPEYGGE
ncbi:MAG: dTDP-4-dehydrorhamnose 3,5-epimerase [Gammaproteobacteria bacterium]|nr:MAG: dTDP-4-dehydrorhamnose 3,5-epimerase [Gammaproteobacteria bacterium]RTZ72108.1 MAG: dTDP-4-dehydrorhamnose 3,5-epimerase [Gammaproteobacteria bacterium]RTZ81328.1 MAG: dTDP-4-dehydrorhamnose 3,5-epimerase [Gammaproteobacteria bacterium]